jgi:hypothetical protein
MLIELDEDGGVKGATFAVADTLATSKGGICVLDLVRGAQLGKFSARPRTLEMPWRR